MLIEAPSSYLMTWTGSSDRITMPAPTRSSPDAAESSTPRESSALGSDSSAVRLPASPNLPVRSTSNPRNPAPARTETRSSSAVTTSAPTPRVPARKPSATLR